MRKDVCITAPPSPPLGRVGCGRIRRAGWRADVGIGPYGGIVDWCVAAGAAGGAGWRTRDARPYGIAFGGGLQRIGCAARAAMKAAPTVKPEARRGVGADAFIGPNPPEAGPSEEGTLAAQAGGRLIAAPTAGSRLVAFAASAQVPKACYLLSIVESRQ